MQFFSSTAAAFAVAFAAALPGQHVLFEEDFAAGIPATWTNIHQGAHLDPWQRGRGLVDGTPEAYHEFFCTNGATLRDNLLLSPPLDLRGAGSAFLEFGQYQGFATARLYNAVVVTTTGGQSTTVVYQETGTWNGFGTVKRDISQWAGLANVQIGFHYRGTIANDWSVDNVRVTTSPVRHEVTNLAQGVQASFDVFGATPGNSVAILLSFTDAGPLATPWGNLNLGAPILFLPTLIADASGRASVALAVPPGTSGIRIYSQAVEIALPATIRITNSLAPTIQ